LGAVKVMKPPLKGQEDISQAYDNTDRRTGHHAEWEILEIQRSPIWHERDSII
jgi:hypothetical protein